MILLNQKREYIMYIYVKVMDHIRNNHVKVP